MPSGGDLNAFVIPLFTQGVGGLFLVLICCTLYIHRRRSYFLLWTLSWFCFSLWVLLRGVSLSGGVPPSPAETAPLWLFLANVAGWCHATLWVLGIWSFHQRRTMTTTGTGLPVGTVAASLAATIIAALTAGLLTWPWQNALLAAGLAVMYGASALALLASWFRHRRFGRLVLATALALAALAQPPIAIGFLEMARSGIILPPPPLFVPFVDFLLETFIAVGMILVLLSEEETLLQDTLRRLAESEDRFRILCEHGGAGLALLSADGLIVQANPALEEMLGHSRGQLNGVRLSDMSHPLDRSDDTRRMRQQPAHPADDQYERERRFLRKDGGVIWARVMRAVVRDAGGAVRYHASVLMDVTERRLAEDALRHTEEVLREERDFVSLVLQTADALVFVADSKGRIVRFNNKCAAVSGYSAAEAQGRVFWELLAPEHYVGPMRAEFARMVGPNAEPPPAVPVEVPWKTRTGAERLIAWRQSSMRDEEGNVSYVIIVGLDVTEQRRLEQQVRQTQKLETLATLVGGIAHDFNNQLTGVLGNLNLVLEDLRAAEENNAPLDEETVRTVRLWTEIAEDAGQRCAAMTGRLLTFSRGRIGSRQPLRLNQLLPEAVRLLRPDLPSSIQLNVRAPEDIWPIHGDWAQLHQVVHALALNARDAMLQGGPLTLGLANRVIGPGDCAADLDARPGRFVELLVEDEGRGMTPAVRSRLFEPFFTTKQASQGAGLGLAEVYGAIKGHQGWIQVDTEPGRGTAFRLYLPAAAETAPGAPAAPAEETGGGECVLVVDDEDMVRNLARMVLERRGFRVVTADGGDAALAQYGAHPGQIDLVLLDYSMPGKTGLQVFEELRKLDPEVCVVFSSGYALEGDASPLLAAGAQGFVPKPYRPDDLVQAVGSVLAERAAKTTNV